MSLRVSKTRITDCLGQNICPRFILRAHWGPNKGDYVSKRQLHASSLSLVSSGGRSTPQNRHFLENLGRSLQSGQGKRSYATVVQDSAGPSPQNPYPYPTHSQPTAHQIFHLANGASQAQIKARYYELVRCHHPDSQHSRLLPPHIAHARFQSIVAAYDFLRGKASSHLPGSKSYGFNHQKSNFDPYLHELARRRRAQQAAKGAGGWDEGFGAPRGARSEPFQEDGFKERTILAFGVFALILGLYPSFVLFPFHLEKTHKAAVVNLAQARHDAREVGGERRDQIRRRVRELHKAGEECDR